jgi:Skp family chaperone for outer membrane proteins
MVTKMKARQLLGSFGFIALAAAVSTTVLSAPARAQTAGGTVIGIASMDKIAQAIHEYQDLLNQLDLDKKSIDATAQDKQNELKSLQQALSYLKTDSPAYATKQDELLKKSIEYDAWAKETQMDYDRKRKVKIKNLFDEIEDAVAQVAQKDQINLVINDQRPKVPDNLDSVDVNQLQQIIGARTVLYSDASRDISGEVITLLDKNYAAKATGAPAAPAAGK